MQPFRLPPRLPVEVMKTYALRAPLATHFRRATCQEVDCPNYAHGWKTVVDVSTDLGCQQANYIRLHSGRSYSCTERESVVEFLFRAGQQCFTDHQVPLEREPQYLIRNGDWRGDPTGRGPRVVSAQAWVDDFGENQQNLADQIKEG